MKKVCEYFGYSRQAYYKRVSLEERRLEQACEVIKRVDKIRQKLPRVGTRKLLTMMDVKVGRDRLFDLLRKTGKLVSRRRRYHMTTNSRHRFRKYPNLVKDNKPSGPNEQYVSDITYIRTDEGYGYLSLVTDRYSRLIVGHDFSRTLAVEGSLRAYKKALKQRRPKGVKTIHHSDRGVQYSCREYVELSERHGIQTSMTEENHVYENAMAERVNGILKTEFGLNGRLRSFAVAKDLIDQSVSLYNNYRPHLALDYKTPATVHAGF